MSKDKLIPELRFPEFEEFGEWDRKTLEFVADSESSNLALNKIEHKKNGYPVYGADSIVGHIDQYQQEEKYISIVKDGSGVGRLNLCIPKSSILGTLACIKSKDLEKFNLDWIYYLMNTIDFTSYKKGSGIPHIYFSDFKIEPIGVPKPQEQQKIASCLSSLDELLAAHNDKLDALKDHKKGLLQNLFPQEGESVPKVRFSEFEGDGEWVEKELSEVSTIITGSTPSTKVPEYYGGDIMFVSPADISNNKYVESTEKTLSLEGFEKTRKIKANSVMFVCIGSTIGKVAMNKFECATNQQINSLVPNNENSSDFLYSNLELNAFKISGIAGNQAVPIINKTLFSSVKLKFPPTKEEQQKIASCLSAVDELITAQQEKIEQLQQHKKGLMQGLFPKIES
ncbi:MAG: restriction endonuclease subunit S [Caldisericia bacterium]|nr:restriction endonuclease subunit S [Caldisericia bacterium]